MKKEITEKAYLTRYKRELYSIGYVKNTVCTKIRCLINFRAFTKKEFCLITEKDLFVFIRHLQKKGLHSSTIQHYYTSIVQFFVFLERELIITRNPCNFYDLQLIKQPKKPRNTISQQEVKQLYKLAKKRKETMVLHLAYGCGLRAKELERINVAHVLLPQKIIKVVKGKNNQHRIVPIPLTMLLDFTTYLHYRASLKVATNALLVNCRGNRLKAYSARVVLQDIIKRSAITKHITLHSLRHSIATHLLQNGMPTEQVQLFLGHKQLETTEIYTRVSSQQLKQLL
ncbi:tyrosine-type recombinase/integrase [uncultured Maribacter sp.]|uniref:tyrosine-type recombinase/integrase n=1 Tax=uncultured Maribacter sp. TaxID=431308 RepID=UPI002626A4D5|nr:tyrosine-type recombinase/integrase [uncultured Maribacter sp.]